MAKSSRHQAAVQRIVASYLRGGDFEGTRDELHELPPEAMADVLAAALQPDATARDLLVMTLADSAYPPAFRAMRTWLEDDNVDDIAMPAASALDALAGKRFKIERFWSGGRAELPEVLRAIAAWWDAGNVVIPSETEWVTEQLAKRSQDLEVVPPSSRALSREHAAALRPDVIQLKQALEKLPLEVQHRLDLAAIRRVLSIYAAYAPEDNVLAEALDGLDR